MVSAVFVSQMGKKEGKYSVAGAQGRYSTGLSSTHDQGGGFYKVFPVGFKFTDRNLWKNVER